MLNKKALRREMRRLRRAVPPDEARRAARILACELSKQPVFRRARHIAFYWAGDGEIDPAPLLLRALRLKKHAYLPVLDPLYGESLRFAPVRIGTLLRANRLGIPEPEIHRRHWRHARQLDLVLTPLVAFDAQGGRMGMGGGFYDRALQHLARQRRWRRPRAVGLAYELQRVPALPREPWDVPLDGVQTERRFYPARQR